MKTVLKSLFLTLVAMVALGGCSKKEEKKPSETAAPQGQVTKKQTTVVVPDNVKGKWKAVKIAVTDKTTKKDTIYTVNIGAEVTLPGGNLTLKVDNFLPQFVMEGTTLTSQSNEPKNPAAQVRVIENGKEIFKGWLFTLYPTTHAFQHPRYGFTLQDFVPAG